MPADIPCRTLLVEDQTLFRAFLARLLHADARFELVGEAGDGHAGWELCQQLRPDLLVLDVNLPGLDGLELAGQAAKLLPEVRILTLTAHRDAHTLSRIMALGLAGYVGKDHPLEILQEALRTLAAGGTYFTTTMRAMRRQIATSSDAFTRILGEREVTVLRRVAAGQTSKGIADELGLSVRTVESHRYRFMRKLELRSVAEVVEFAIRHGLLTK